MKYTYLISILYDTGNGISRGDRYWDFNYIPTAGDIAKIKDSIIKDTPEMRSVLINNMVRLSGNPNGEKLYDKYKYKRLK